MDFTKWQVQILEKFEKGASLAEAGGKEPATLEATGMPTARAARATRLKLELEAQPLKAKTKFDDYGQVRRESLQAGLTPGALEFPTPEEAIAAAEVDQYGGFTKEAFQQLPEVVRKKIIEKAQPKQKLARVLRCKSWTQPRDTLGLERVFVPYNQVLKEQEANMLADLAQMGLSPRQMRGQGGARSVGMGSPRGMDQLSAQA